MAESIFIRVQRVLSAGAETTVDAMERASGTSLMREAVRQVDRAADEIRTELAVNRNRRADAERRQRLIREQLATLDEQARFALGKGREDLAQAAVSRQLEYEAEAKRLKEAQTEAADEAERLDQCLAALKLRKAEMEKELAAFRAGRSGGAAVSERTERKVARAEAAFERAMTAAGGVGVGLGDPQDAAKLAEVEALQRESAIADRLAALKAKQQDGGKRPRRSAAAR